MIYSNGKTCCIFHELNPTTSKPNLGVQSCQRSMIQNKQSKYKLMIKINRSKISNQGTN